MRHMDEQVSLEHVLGGIAALHDELKIMNTWLHKLYNVDMTILAHDEPGVFEKLNLVHNQLGMFMEDDWEEELE